MITLDKVKLIAALDCLLDFDPAQFSVVKEGGRTKTMKFKVTEPFTLSVEVNQDAKEFVVEFTGKILGKDYPQLISRETIMMCFDRLNEFGVCKVDPAKMMTAEVVICRFELNLTSKKQIREALCLTGNTLEEVLNAERNPIQDFLGDVLAEDPAGKAVTNWNTFEKYAV